MQQFAIIIGCLVLLAACGEGDQERDVHASDAVNIHDKEQASWLRRTDQTDPAVWLASKERQRALSPSDPAVEGIRRAFSVAGSHFLESERMLANRTAQLGEMLAADGKPEDYATIIEGLSSVVNAERGKETYGELCQYYFSLRHSGAERAEALANLATRYGVAKQR